MYKFTGPAGKPAKMKRPSLPVMDDESPLQVEVVASTKTPAIGTGGIPRVEDRLTMRPLILPFAESGAVTQVPNGFFGRSTSALGFGSLWQCLAIALSGLGSLGGIQ
jgi:hypothetical protein